MMDGNRNPYPNGAVFSFNASTLASAGYFATSAGVLLHDGGGIWQDGAGLAYAWDNNHGTHYIYFNTGNGVYDADTNGGTDYGDSFLKLYQKTSATIAPAPGTITNYSFTPADSWYRDNTCGSTDPNAGDWDLDSGGVMLIPEHELFDPSLSVSADKEGGIYFVDRTTPGGHNPSCDGLCNCPYDDNNVIVQNFWIGSPHAGPVVHTTPAFWEGGTTVTNYLYLASQKGTVSGSGELLQYTLCPSAAHPISCNTTPVIATNTSNSAVIFKNGVTPTISQSSGDSSDAIVWALWSDGLSDGSTVPGVLYAFDAITMKQIYSSSTCPGRDNLAPTTKFSVPSVANGLVFIGGEGPIGNTDTGMFYIFGPNANGSC